MTASEFVRTDTAEDAVSSLELALDFYERAVTDGRYWKWFVVATHAGIQGVFALALEDGNGLLVQKKQVAARTLAAWEQGSAPPEPHMDNFVRLYRKLHEGKNLRSSSARPLPESPQSDLAVEGLDSLRDEFLHFNTKSWSIERALMQARARASLEVAEFVLVESGSILWYDDSVKQRAYAAIHNLLVRLVEEI